MIGREGFRSIKKHTKVMCINFKEHPQIKIDEEELEVVTDFTYLCSNNSVENSVEKHISARINNARNSYCSLRNIWKSNVNSLKTKVRGGSPIFPLVVHQTSSASIWPAVQLHRRGLSRNPGVTIWCVCGHN